MKNHFRNFALVLIVLVVFGTFFGCSKKDNVDDTTQNTKDGSSNDNVLLAEPSYGGEVVVGILQDLDSLDQHKAVAAGTKEVLYNIYEGLVKPNPDGDFVPAVAKEWDVQEGGKRYEFTIQDNATFHNGASVTAKDVIYSIKRSAGLLPEGDPSIVTIPALFNVADVVELEEKKVAIILKEADTELLGYLTSAIIPDGYTDCDKNPIGTGPFSFVSYKPLEYFEIAKFEQYYGEKPYLDKVKFKIVANTDAASMELQSGTIDIFPYLTDAQAQQLSGKFNIEVGSMNLIQALFLNNESEVFKDKNVRTALNYAIDKQMILDMVAGGRGNTIGTNMPSSMKKYYASELDTVYSYDPQKAKDILKEAGYENLSFTITVPSNYQYHVDTAQVIVAQLKEVGIDAKIQLVEWATWLSDVYAGRKYEATIVGLDAKMSARDALDRYDSSSETNFVNYKNVEYDKVLKNAIASVNEEEKVALYKELQKMLTMDSASVYLQDPPLLVAINKELSGYTFYPVYVQDLSKVYYVK